MTLTLLFEVRGWFVITRFSKKLHSRPHETAISGHFGDRNVDKLHFRADERTIFEKKICQQTTREKLDFRADESEVFSMCRHFVDNYLLMQFTLTDLD